MSILQQNIDLKKHTPFLVVALVGVSMAGAYYKTRIEPQELHFSMYVEEITRLKSEVGNTRVPPPAANDLAADARESLQQATAKRDQLRLELAAKTANMVDLGSDNAVHEVMLELSGLASAHGVNIQSTEPSDERPSGMAATTAQNDPIKQRPRRKLVLEASYFSLVEFFTALGNTRHAVTLLRLQLKAGSDGQSYSPLLKAELVTLL